MATAIDRSSPKVWWNMLLDQQDPHPCVTQFLGIHPDSFLPSPEGKKARERESERERDWLTILRLLRVWPRFWPRFWFQHWPTAELFHSVLPPPDSLRVDQDSCSSPFTDQDSSKDTLVASNPKKQKIKQNKLQSFGSQFLWWNLISCHGKIEF